MRWDDLFRDLEAQLAAAEAVQRDDELADRTRREAALLRLVDRARASVGQPVTVRVLGAGALEGALSEVGSQWVLLAEDGGREALVPWRAVLALAGLTAWSGAPGSGGQVFERLGLGSALRGIARDRLPVQVWLTDGSTVTGTVDRVGADFLEVSEHAAGEPRRRTEVTGVRTVPFAALAVLRRGG
jgi:hypothetical protein